MYTSSGRNKNIGDRYKNHHRHRRFHRKKTVHVVVVSIASRIIHTDHQLLYHNDKTTGAERMSEFVYLLQH